MLLAEVGLGELLWSLLTIFFMVVYFIVLIRVVFDLFADHETSGGAKALWFILLLFFPVLSILAYLILRGPSMERRATARAVEAQGEFQSYVQKTAATATPADQIARAKELLDDGIIDDGEFEQLKAKALAA